MLARMWRNRSSHILSVRLWAAKTSWKVVQHIFRILFRIKSPVISALSLRSILKFPEHFLHFHVLTEAWLFPENTPSEALSPIFSLIPVGMEVREWCSLFISTLGNSSSLLLKSPHLHVEEIKRIHISDDFQDQIYTPGLSLLCSLS